MKKLTKGFTLIELLVVIAIIGILSSVVLASLNSARQKARDARRISDLGQVKLALELYADSSAGQYPSVDYAGLDDPDYLVPTYIGSMPEDPLDAPHPQYTYNASSSISYTLCATLENANNPVLGGASTTLYCIEP